MCGGGRYQGYKEAPGEIWLETRVYSGVSDIRQQRVGADGVCERGRE